MRLDFSSFSLPCAVVPDPHIAQARLVELLSKYGDLGNATAALIQEYQVNQRKIDQRHLDRAVRDMNDAADELRRELDWLSIGAAAKLIRMRRSTVHAAVMCGDIDHRIIVVRGVPARHVRRCSVLDWHESRERKRRNLCNTC